MGSTTVLGRSVALPEGFASRLEPHQLEGLALFPTWGKMEGKGTCAESSGLFGLGCLSIKVVEGLS